jgi:hypothetical protein
MTNKNRSLVIFMGFLLLGNLSVNDQGTGRFSITKVRKAPKGYLIPPEPIARAPSGHSFS